MTLPFGRKSGTKRGQSTVEFALIAPMLFTVIFAIIDIAWAMYQDHTIDTAARSAARAGAVGQSDAVMIQGIKGFCTGLNVHDADITITVTNASGTTQPAGTRTAKSGLQINVTIDHDLQFFTWIDKFFKSVNKTKIRAQSQFLID